MFKIHYCLIMLALPLLAVDNLAHSASSVAMGTNTQAEGYNSIAIGRNVTTSGVHSTGMAFYSSARSFGETVLGINATDVAPFSATEFNLNDRLLTVGNGQFGSPSDALTIFKNGNTQLNGILTIDADNAGGNGAYTLPGNDGTAGTFVVTNGAGISNWSNSIPMLTVTNTFTNSSDKRLKKNFSRLNKSLDKISLVNGYHYNWNSKSLQDTVALQTGLIAQEVENIFPELVKNNPDGFKSLNYIGLIPHLLEAIKTLKSENDSLKIENSELQKKVDSSVNALDARLKNLEAMLLHQASEK